MYTHVHLLHDDIETTSRYKLLQMHMYVLCIWRNAFPDLYAYRTLNGTEREIILLFLQHFQWDHIRITSCILRAPINTVLLVHVIFSFCICKLKQCKMIIVLFNAMKFNIPTMYLLSFKSGIISSFKYAAQTTYFVWINNTSCRWI